MKPTKKQIQETLRTLDSTKIFRIAKLSGVDINNRINVMRFVEKYAPTQKIERAAFRLTLCADHANQLKTVHNRIEQPISNAINYAKRQIENGAIRTNYGKILIEGNTRIYWAHPTHGHSDYNKSAAMPNTETNRRAATLINSILSKQLNHLSHTRHFGQ